MYVRKRALDRLAAEKVLYERRPGGDLSVCVTFYPNIYRLAMANLGFQSVFHIFETGFAGGRLSAPFFPMPMNALICANATNGSSPSSRRAR